MHVNESGTNYTVYIQNDYYYNLGQKMSKDQQIRGDKLGAPTTEAEKVAGQDLAISWQDMQNGPDGGIQAYVDKVIASIPELKGKKDLVTSVMFLPENLNDTAKTAINNSVNTMQQNGESENLLKNVIGVVSFHYNYSGDETQSPGMLRVKNETFTATYDKQSLQKTIAKFQEVYGATSETSQGLGRFSNILSQCFDELNNLLKNPTVSSSTQGVKDQLQKQTEAIKQQQEDTILNLVDAKPQDLQGALQTINSQLNQNQTAGQA